MLEIQNGRDTLNKCLDEDEKGVDTVYTLGGNQKKAVGDRCGGSFAAERLSVLAGQ